MSPESLLGVILLFGASAAAMWFLRRSRTAANRSRAVEEEDVLKQLFHLGEKGVAPGIESIAGTLHRTPDKIALVVERLVASGLVTVTPRGVTLTERGRRSALNIVRTHRLWERFLADKTGVAESDWHRSAEKAEHRLTPKEADQLSRSLGDPVFDPHGDPIPRPDGVMPARRGGSLASADAGSTFLVIHVEDEPASVYAELMSKRIVPGVRLSVVENSGQGVVVEAEGERHRLTALAAGNVTVSPAKLRRPTSVSLRTLAEIPVGSSGRVAEISPAVRGMQRRRLLDLGLVPGTVVRAEFKSPTGDPTAYTIRGALVALRAADASLIKVENESAP